MAHAKALSDFVLTGCAIVPAIGLAFGQPEVALFSHIILLFGGILTAASEDDAPFKQTDPQPENAADTPAGKRPSAPSLASHHGERLALPLQRQSDNSDKSASATSAHRNVQN